MPLNNEELQHLYEQAERLRRSGEPREAALLIQGHLQDIPAADLSRAYQKIIRACDEGGARKTAVEYAYKLRDLNPSDPLLARFLAGQQAAQVGQQVRTKSRAREGIIQSIVEPGRYEVYFPITNSVRILWEYELG